MVTRPGEIESSQLERIVREVMQRLHEIHQTTIASNEKTNCAQDRHKASMGPALEMSTTSVLKLRMPVITLAEVEGRLDGVREVVIGSQSLLTPAVRDVLTQQRIAVTRTTTETDSTSHPHLLVGGMLETGQCPESYWQQLQQLGIGCQQVVGTNLTGILQEMAPLLAGGTRVGMLLTVETAVALCLANRHTGVRAILAAHEDAILRDTRAVGANLLIVSPRGVSAFQVGSMVSQFCHGGILPCPEKYRAWLH